MKLISFSTPRLPAVDEAGFNSLFPPGIPVVINFHGYVGQVASLLFERHHCTSFVAQSSPSRGTNLLCHVYSCRSFAIQIARLRRNRYYDYPVDDALGELVLALRHRGGRAQARYVVPRTLARLPALSLTLDPICSSHAQLLVPREHQGRGQAPPRRLGRRPRARDHLVVPPPDGRLPPLCRGDAAGYVFPSLSGCCREWELTLSIAPPPRLTRRPPRHRRRRDARRAVSATRELSSPTCVERICVLSP